MNRIKSVVAALLWLGLALPVQAELDWQGVLAGSQRSDNAAARDSFRHPRETLQFFGLRGDMTVVEISPGGGWYTELLAPLLRDTGKVYAVHGALNPSHPYYRRSLGKYLQLLGENDDSLGQVVVMQWQPPQLVTMAPAASADMVLTFRNVHNWMNSGTAETMFNAAYKALKPGGVFGVVEHRAKPGTSRAAMIKSGYVTESQVLAFAEQAGFELSAKSEINANAADSADHPKGVWTLPPSLRLGEENREKYIAIGESDRMTLRFTKPN